MSRAEIIKAYRALYRACLQAVMYSKPSRFVVRDQLREGFRDPSGHFDKEAVQRTVLFLRSAARERGLAHKIVKNLVHVAWRQQKMVALPYHIRLQQAKQAQHDPIEVTALAHYKQTVDMLNRTMKLCLREPPRLSLDAVVATHAGLADEQPDK